MSWTISSTLVLVNKPSEFQWALQVSFPEFRKGRKGRKREESPNVDRFPSCFVSLTLILFSLRTHLDPLLPSNQKDFSLKQYCFKHKKTDKFSLGDAEEYIIPTLQDALKRNKEMNIILSPWSPPPYLKTSGLLSGGEFIEGGEDDLAEYFLDTVKAFEEKDIPVWAFTMQNEPFLESSWFASMKLSPKQQGEVAGRLRSKLDKAGYHSIKLLAHDHNW